MMTEINNSSPSPYLSGRPLRLLDPKSDVVFKKIFGQHPDLIKSFLNGILPLPEDGLIESVVYITPEQSPRIPAMKNTIVDVKCTDQNGRIFIVEMQMSWSKSFLQRFLFGTSKAYVQQLGAGEPYHTLCPVYGLAIVNETFETTTENWFHHYRLTNTKDIDKTLEGIELIFLELPKFNPQTFQHRKMGALWLRFLKEINEKISSIPPEFQDNVDLTKAVELAQESFYSRAELDAYDYYLDALRVDLTVRDDAYNDGVEKGREEGEEKLRQEKQKYVAEKKEMARKLLTKGLSIKEVSDLTGLSTSDVSSFSVDT